ncbi:MAG: DsbA family protein [Alphaproteobacteria bacterium]
MRLVKLVRRGAAGRAAAAVTLILGLALGLSAAPARAQEQSLPGGFSPEQTQGIERIVRDYLLANPEVLVDALNEYQQRQKLAEEQLREQTISQRQRDLEQDPATPVLGNPKGDVVVVEFFDYRCPYCKRVAEMVRDEVANDGEVRLVMKEFPILGPQSMQAARAALAAAMQDKYEEFHFALMLRPGDMSDVHIDTVAELVGLDVQRLRRDMTSTEVEIALGRNIALAKSIGIRGTPAFIIGKTLVPGAIDAETFRQLVAKERARAS